MFSRLLDILVSLAVLLLTLPVFLVTAIMIVIDDFGPVFYRAKRVGIDDSVISVYKFRSMRVGSDKMGAGVTSAEDTRVTKIGKHIRRFKIDELPQFFNVLRGDLSIVGPRPEDPRYVALYSDEQRQILKFKPGITSPASLAFRHEESLLEGTDWERVYVQEVMPAKLNIDLAYLGRRSLASDMKIIIDTARAVFE